MEEDIKGSELSNNVIRIDDERVRDHLGRIVRGTVEETLNAMLEAKADRYAMPDGTNGRKPVVISAPTATIASCSPKLAKFG